LQTGRAALFDDQNCQVPRVTGNSQVVFRIQSSGAIGNPPVDGNTWSYRFTS
jgi:hypothetical protein